MRNVLYLNPCVFAHVIFNQIEVQKVSDFSFSENDSLRVVAQLGSLWQCTRTFCPKESTIIHSNLLLPIEQVRYWLVAGGDKLFLHRIDEDLTDIVSFNSTIATESSSQRCVDNTNQLS